MRIKIGQYAFNPVCPSSTQATFCRDRAWLRAEREVAMAIVKHTQATRLTLVVPSLMGQALESLVDAMYANP